MHGVLKVEYGTKSSITDHLVSLMYKRTSAMKTTTHQKKANANESDARHTTSRKPNKAKTNKGHKLCIY